MVSGRSTENVELMRPGKRGQNDKQLYCIRLSYKLARPNL